MGEKQKNVKVFSYLKKYKFSLSYYILTAVINVVVGLFVVMLTTKGLEYLTQAPIDYKNFLIITAISVGLEIFNIFNNMSADIVSKKFVNNMAKDINVDIIKHICKLDNLSYQSHSTGQILKRAVGDPQQIGSGIIAIIDDLTNVLKNCVIFIYLTTLNYLIGLAWIFVMIVNIIFQIFITKKQKEATLVNHSKSEEVSSVVTELIKSQQDLKTLSLSNEFVDVASQKYGDLRDSVIKYNVQLTRLKRFRGFLNCLFVFGIIALGIYTLNTGMITLAIFLIINSYRGIGNALALQFSGILGSVTQIKVATQRINALFDEDEFTTEKFGTKFVENIKGNIEFKNVCFAHKDYKILSDAEFIEAKKKNKNVLKKELKSENKVFDDLSFKIKSNKTIAFVGKSGSGKTTIVDLICGLLKPDSGQVLLDGVDISELDEQSIRQNITVVNQFPYIFNMSIKDNLKLIKKDASDEEIKQALKDAALLDFVESLRDGIDTIVGEGGVKLSGGQKQRLAISRAILRKSSIIIFDESTSSLDNFAQNDIKSTLKAMKGKATIIIVAHRLSTIKDADVINFLENGKIVTTGTFDELMKKNKTFKNMFLSEDLNDKINNDN